MSNGLGLREERRMATQMANWLRLELTRSRPACRPTCYGVGARSLIKPAAGFPASTGAD